MREEQQQMLKERYTLNHRTKLELITLLLILVFPIIFSMNNGYFRASASDSAVHNINTGIHYQAIQEAIDAPQTANGHTILVDEGTYFEHVVMHKAIKLLGANQSTTFIDGNGTGQVVALTANASEIAGFTVKNGEWGINLEEIQNASVTENQVSNCSYAGIKLRESSGCTVANNTATSTNNAGIYLWESEINSVANNSIASVTHGLWLLNNSTNNTLSNNLVINSPQGIVAAPNCNNNTIRDNTVASSSTGGIVMEYAFYNVIFHNNLLENDKQVWSYSGSLNFWDSDYPSGGNYWSDYNGTDANDDDIGDTPYVIDADNIDRYPLMAPLAPIPTPTPSPTPTVTPSPSPSPTPTPSPSPTPTPSPSPAATPTPTPTSASTPSPSPTTTPSPAPTPTPATSPTATPWPSPTSPPETGTPPEVYYAAAAVAVAGIATTGAVLIKRKKK